jgi:uncharacterized membrane protein
VDFVVFLHVLAALISVGPLIVFTSATPRFIGQGVEGLPTLRFLARSTQIYGAITVLVFGLGLALVPGKDHSFNEFWLSASMTLYIVAVALVFAVIVPDQRKAVTRLEAGTDAPVRAGRIAAVSGATALIWAVILLLMIYQWGS